MDAMKMLLPAAVGVGVCGVAQGAFVSIDMQQSTLFASTAIASGDSGPGPFSPIDWTGAVSFNDSEGSAEVLSPFVQASSASTQNNAVIGESVEGEGQATSFGTTDGTAEVDGDSVSRFELVFTTDGMTPFSLSYTLSTFDVGDSLGEAMWELEQVSGSSIGSSAIAGNSFESDTFETVLAAGQYRFVIEGQTDVSGGFGDLPGFSSASGGFTFAVLIPSPGASGIAVVAGLFLMPRRRRRVG
jgi:hypothetical protein